jgi:hypothetical protein
MPDDPKKQMDEIASLFAGKEPTTAPAPSDGYGRILTRLAALEANLGRLGKEIFELRQATADKRLAYFGREGAVAELEARAPQVQQLAAEASRAQQHLEHLMRMSEQLEAEGISVDRAELNHAVTPDPNEKASE